MWKTMPVHQGQLWLATVACTNPDGQAMVISRNSEQKGELCILNKLAVKTVILKNYQLTSRLPRLSSGDSSCCRKDTLKETPH